MLVNVMNDNSYVSPLASRYASKEVSFLFSSSFKYTTWRKLWIALAESQKELGLKINQEQIEEMKKNLSVFDYPLIAEYEKRLKHDVMAHLKAYCALCPNAAPIIHLGATSAYVTDNGDLIQILQALDIVEKKLVQLIRNLSAFSSKYASLAVLSYTHLQPAQPTTLGKRATLWLQDFLFDLKDLIYRKENLLFLGVKGATGSQASLMALFDNDSKKVTALDERVALKMGFPRVLKVSSQTYPRKQDIHILDLLANLAVSSHKFATDLRLLSHLKEMEEPFEEDQVGSSAMPYKRNPHLSERICSLSRFLISLSENPRYTAATQWLERTLDDSANRRLSLAESFLAADGILEILLYVTSDLHVYPKMIEKHLREELPFMAIENILMEGVKKGKNRQDFHEKLRLHSLHVRQKLREGEEVDLIETFLSDKEFPLTGEELNKILKGENFIGRSPQQVKEYLEEEVYPLLEKFHYVQSISPSSLKV